ncbi:MSCRAMM family protein [Lachnoclostridium sp. An169]|uniref:MSCRAMM family protein n=1 Tax=Lachnoclostridium sp. An169 TaxID=1965569 RepID=UPI0013A6282E|nr:SpaA isopeptide-forming pilin-related protein [Lachnoclostridium sp. An169]
MKRRTRLLSGVLFSVFLLAAAGGSRSFAGEDEGADSISGRMSLAEELGLSGYVDPEGYLTEEYLGDKSTLELERSGTAQLIRSYSPETAKKKVPAGVKSAVRTAVPAARSAGGTVTASELVRYMNTVVGYFEVNGIQAFCAEHGVDRPLVGETTSAPETVTDSMQRKVLYYGYSGPKQWSGIFSFEQGRAVTSLALSYYYSGADSLNWGIHGNYSTQMGLSGFIDYIESAAEAPEGFKVYKVSTGNGAKQDLMYWEYQPNGYLSLAKRSANTSVTAQNPLYSLEGAKYGVYTDEACRTPALTADTGVNAVLETDASGNAGTVCLKVGTYYVKEIKAPQGYKADDAAVKVSVAANHTSAVPNTPVVTDTPVMLPVSILLRKVDAETGGAAQGTGSLEGAQFRVKFYGTRSSSDPAKDGDTPLRTWIFVTDAEGKLKYSTEYLLSGDDLYYDAGEKPALPYGTLTFEEIAPPPGYLADSQIITASIEEGSGGSGTIVYQEPVQKENIIRLNLKKVQSGTDLPVSGVVFEHTGPDGTKTRYTTDSEGMAVIRGLREGKHTVREVGVPDGLSLNENVITFTVDRKGNVTVTSKAEVTELSGAIVVTAKQAGATDIRVENQPAPFTLKICKENEKGKVLEGAKFTLYSDSGCSRTVAKAVTGKDGTLTLEGLHPGTVYYLKETEAPAGYRLPMDEEGEDVVWEICAESSVPEGTFTFYVNGKAYTDREGQFCVEGTKKDRIARMTIYNETGIRLPKTGSGGTLLMTAAGILLAAAAFTVSVRDRGTGRRKR